MEYNTNNVNETENTTAAQVENEEMPTPQQSMWSDKKENTINGILGGALLLACILNIFVLQIILLPIVIYRLYRMYKKTGGFKKK